MNWMAHIAKAIMLDDRYFVRFQPSGRVLTGWSLAGARLFGPWLHDEIEKACKRLRAKGYSPVLVDVSNSHFRIVKQTSTGSA